MHMDLPGRIKASVPLSRSFAAIGRFATKLKRARDELLDQPPGLTLARRGGDDCLRPTGYGQLIAEVPRYGRALAPTFRLDGVPVPPTYLRQLPEGATSAPRRPVSVGL
jgi:hypothetical protein